MERITEIEERLSAIPAELEAEGADLDALEEEVRALKAEKAEIEERAAKEAEEKRQALLQDIAEGRKGKEIDKMEEIKVEERELDLDEVLESKEYRYAWSKKLQGKKLTEAEERAYAYGDTNNAVPTAVSDKFIEKLKKLAPMIDEIGLSHIPANLKFVAEDTVTDALIHTENSSVTPAGDTVVNYTLGAHEFIKVIKISEAASAMSIPQFENWLVSKLARDISRKIDEYILNGTNCGITQGTFTTSVNQILDTTGVIYKDLTALVALLPAGYDPNAKFLMHKSTLWNDVKGLLDTQNRPIFDPESKTLLGFDVLTDDYVTTSNKAIYFGDFEEAYQGNFVQDINVKRSEEAGFADAAILYRGLAIFDGKVVQPNAVVRFVTTA